MEEPGSETLVVWFQCLLWGTLLYYLLAAVLWKDIWGSYNIMSLALRVRNPSPREGQWFAQGHNYFVTEAETRQFALLCARWTWLGTGYGDSSLHVPCTFIISAIHKPVLKSWKNGWPIQVFKLSFLMWGALVILWMETSFLLAWDTWQFIGYLSFYVWG